MLEIVAFLLLAGGQAAGPEDAAAPGPSLELLEFLGAWGDDEALLDKTLESTQGDATEPDDPTLAPTDREHDDQAHRN